MATTNRDRAQELYLQGWIDTDIARELGISRERRRLFNRRCGHCGARLNSIDRHRRWCVECEVGVNLGREHQPEQDAQIQRRSTMTYRLVKSPFPPRLWRRPYNLGYPLESTSGAVEPRRGAQDSP